MDDKRLGVRCPLPAWVKREEALSEAQITVSHATIEVSYS